MNDDTQKELKIPLIAKTSLPGATIVQEIKPAADSIPKMHLKAARSHRTNIIGFAASTALFAASAIGLGAAVVTPHQANHQAHETKISMNDISNMAGLSILGITGLASLPAAIVYFRKMRMTGRMKGLHKTLKR